MNIKNKKIISFILLIVIGGGALLFILKKNKETPVSQEENKNNEAPQSDGIVTIQSDGSQKYENISYGFTFIFPKEFHATTFTEGDAGVVLVEDTQKNKAFQIYVTSFDEKGPITPTRIKKDIPHMVIENPQNVLTGAKKNIQGLIFFSKDESVGKTREVWFVHDEFLYQVTGHADLDSLIGQVMDSMKFGTQ